MPLTRHLNDLQIILKTKDKSCSDFVMPIKPFSSHLADKLHP